MRARPQPRQRQRRHRSHRTQPDASPRCRAKKPESPPQRGAPSTSAVVALIADPANGSQRPEHGGSARDWNVALLQQPFPICAARLTALCRSSSELGRAAVKGVASLPCVRHFFVQGPLFVRGPAAHAYCVFQKLRALPRKLTMRDLPLAGVGSPAPSSPRDAGVWGSEIASEALKSGCDAQSYPRPSRRRLFTHNAPPTDVRGRAVLWLTSLQAR